MPCKPLKFNPNIHHHIYYMKPYLFILYFVLIAAACKKNQTPPPPVLSSEKRITSFAFTAANNTASHVPADVYASISNDSILITLPDSVQITNLIPTVKFTGNSINPPSDAAQDFSKKIMYTVTAEMAAYKTIRLN
jgi:hypothetical protein